MNPNRLTEDIDLELVWPNIGDKYKLKDTDKLGSGGFSNIYKMHHEILGIDFVLKVMDSEYILKSIAKNYEIKENVKEKYLEVKDRFINEAKLYEKIKHPNIVVIIDVGEVHDDKRHIDVPYSIMEYIEGNPLGNFLKAKQPLEINGVFKISQNILSALAALHQKGIIHRDIKPGNIMIRKDNGEAVLIDFGLAKDLLREKDLTDSDDRIRGTFKYMSPEQMESFKNLEKTTDIYSFGLVLFEMLTGKHPFEGKGLMIPTSPLDSPGTNVRELNPYLPEGIENIVYKAIANDPADRYQSAEGFLSALKELEDSIAKSPIPVKPPVIRDEPAIAIKPKRKTSKVLLYFAGIIAAVLSAFIIFNPLGIGKVDPQYQKHITSVNRYIDSGDYEKASEFLQKAKEIKESNEINILSAKIAGLQRMKAEFEKLKRYVQGEAVDRDKLERCRKFLHDHQDVYKNSDTGSMVSETNKFIPQLEGKINASAQIAAMKKDFGDLGKFYNGNAPGVNKLKECNNFLAKYENIPADSETEVMISQARNFGGQLQKEMSDEEQHQSYLANARRYIQDGDLNKARTSLANAIKIKGNTTETVQINAAIADKQNEIKEYEQKHGKKEYDRIKDSIKFSKYRAFVGDYPESVYIENLKKRLRKADKNLPPEAHWNVISQNNKGYYERTFANNHLMIYIPEKKFWIDKYEVSNAQFRAFAKASKIELPANENKLIKSDDEYPVVATFENARRYCQKYGFRLPTEEEWGYAAGKAKGHKYPWGDESPDEGGIYRANFYPKDGKKKEDGFDGTAPVKSFKQFSSPFGVVNMAGNVTEWIKGNIKKGGDFFSFNKFLEITSKITIANDNKDGFRCIKTEEIGVLR